MTTLASPTEDDVFGTGPSVTLSCVHGDRTLWWGNSWQWATAAYWADQASRCTVEPGRFRLGTNLREEVASCILGGYGIPAAVGLSAFVAVREAGVLDGPGREHEIEAVLRRPLRVADRELRYRFPRQRACRLAGALSYLHGRRLPTDPLAAREVLLGAPGVGMKTASWVVRNHFDSDDVAILDIHIRRAGEAAGVFDRSWDVTRRYLRYEGFFLAWARHAKVRPSVLDALIWSELAQIGSTNLPSRHP